MTRPGRPGLPCGSVVERSAMIPVESNRRKGEKPRMTPEQARQWLEHAPADPGKIADGLRGWITIDEHFYCAVCTGRLLKRGCANWTIGASPVWDPEAPPGPCAACGKGEAPPAAAATAPSLSDP